MIGPGYSCYDEAITTSPLKRGLTWTCFDVRSAMVHSLEDRTRRDVLKGLRSFLNAQLRSGISSWVHRGFQIRRVMITILLGLSVSYSNEYKTFFQNLMNIKCRFEFSPPFLYFFMKNMSINSFWFFHNLIVFYKVEVTNWYNQFVTDVSQQSKT